ncbi:hypothetical protein, partial [Micromonospora sp. KC606]|uniref:hypothetical protein n=1 Tax=Micromonospora sp. KC606 TaxID=2530379 RepID=UPI001A9EC848
ITKLAARATTDCIASLAIDATEVRGDGECLLGNVRSVTSALLNCYRRQQTSDLDSLASVV